MGVGCFISVWRDGTDADRPSADPVARNHVTDNPAHNTKDPIAIIVGNQRMN